jgi:myo-inositol 2-dehydrogenase/D-chiro-inositol 1-dehydrogenase
MSIRLAIIGAGIMGADHARIFAENLSDSEVKVICDINKTAAGQIAEKYNIPNVADKPEEVIARDDIDAVVIASPDFTHAPLSKLCIQAQKPVLCEKPLSQSSVECTEILDAEIKAGRKFVQLGFMRRYDQSYQETRQALQKGEIGKALMMHNHHRNVENPSKDFTGLMAITNSAPHEFDVVRYVLNTEYKTIHAWQPQRSDALVAPVVMVIETTDGQLVTIEINNNASYGYDVRFELVGEKGGINSNNVSFVKKDIQLQANTKYASDWRDRYADAYLRQNKDFLNFVKTGQFPTIAADAWDGYCTAVVAEAGAEALQKGQKVSINLNNQPEFYK